MTTTHAEVYTMDTNEVLQAMMTENTGRHMLDSGGAYGRNWERNQGIDFEDEPEATWNGGPTVNVYHWLKERVSYAPVMDRLFHIFSADSDESWYQDMQGFAEAMSDDKYEGVWGYNTYNGECLLSQTLQWTAFTHDSEYYILLQVHGGADVRGGYTAPRVFQVDYGFGHDVADAEIYCNSGKPIPVWPTRYEDEPVDVMGVITVMPVKQWTTCEFRLSIRGGSIDTWMDPYDDGNEITQADIDAVADSMWNWDAPKCPHCGDELAIAAPYPYC
jgi:hypothetical protein